MRTVFNNEMVAHVWAQQNQDHGRSNNGNFYFKGAVIYSYRDTWPLAFFIDEQCKKFKQHVNADVLVNNESYSKSTGQHLSDVTSALHSRYECIADSDLMCSLVRVNQSGYERDKDKAMLAVWAEYHYKKFKQYDRRYAALCVKYKDSFKRAPAQFRDAAWKMVQHGKEFNRTIGLLKGDERPFYSGKRVKKIPEKEVTRITTLWAVYDMYMNERDEKKREKERREYELREQRRIAEFQRLKPYEDQAIAYYRRTGHRRCDDLTINDALDAFINDWSAETRLRYAQGTVYTSRGAEVPLDHAKGLIKAVQRYTREPLTAEDVSPDSFQERIVPSRIIRVGHFSLSYIDTRHKYLKIGCHKLTFDEINAFIDYAKEHHPEAEITDEYKLP